jgi:hypothetical protein
MVLRGGVTKGLGAGLGLCTVLSLGAGGCGSVDTAQQGSAANVRAGALARIRASVGVTEKSGSAHFVTTGRVQGIGGLAPSGTTSSIGVGDVDFAGPNIELTTGAAGGASSNAGIRVLRIGNSVYISTSRSGWQWSRSQIRPDNVNWLGVITPIGLETTKGPVTVIGNATLGGQPTIEYGVQFAGSAAKQTGQSGASQVVTTEPFVAQVWLDAAGRIVRTSGTAVYSIDPIGGSSTSASASYKSTSTVNLSRLGEVVALSRPKNVG